VRGRSGMPVDVSVIMPVDVVVTDRPQARVAVMAINTPGAKMTSGTESYEFCRSSFAPPPKKCAGRHDFATVGIGSILVAMFRAFAVNSSPPRTAVGP
jgi:hypothetical protein